MDLLLRPIIVEKMNRMTKFGAWVVVAGITCSAAFAGHDTEATSGGQFVADLLREAGGADIAFMPADGLRAKFEADNFKTILKYPTEGISVITLTGTQIRQALERSVSLAPTPNDGFLQVSNLEFTYNPRQEPDRRIVSLNIAGAKLDEKRTYTVAMPANLARGGLGYFKVWDREQIKKSLAGVTMEDILAQKAFRESAGRIKTAN